jgi:segregation and condensation protein B
MRDLGALEAVLFVTEAPVPLGELAEVLELPKRRVEELLTDLGKELAERESGLVLREVAGGWRLYSHPDAYPFLERFSASSPTANRWPGRRSPRSGGWIPTLR